MSDSLYIFTICLPFVTILLVFAMRAVSSAVQARARQANDDAYRHVAQKAAAAQSEISTALSAIQAAVTEMRQRIAAIETVLKDVG